LRIGCGHGSALKYERVVDFVNLAHPLLQLL